MKNLTKKQLDYLNCHNSVEKITSKQVIFSFEFKLKAVKNYLAGVPASKTFEDEKLDLFPRKFMTNAVLRWREKYSEHGESGLKNSKKGRKPIHFSDNSELSHEQLLAKVEFLEQENDFLKKLKALRKK